MLVVNIIPSRRYLFLHGMETPLNGLAGSLGGEKGLLMGSRRYLDLIFSGVLRRAWMPWDGD